MILLTYETPEGFLSSVCLHDGVTEKEIFDLARLHKKNWFAQTTVSNDLLYNTTKHTDCVVNFVYRYNNAVIWKYEKGEDSPIWAEWIEPQANCYIGKFVKFKYPENKVRIVKVTFNDHIYIEGKELTGDEDHVKTFRVDKIVGDVQVINL